MKTLATASSGPPPGAKRRWKGLATVILVLVFFSLLVPLAFLFIVHKRFPSGYASEERTSQEPGFLDAGGEVSSENEDITNQVSENQTNITNQISESQANLPVDLHGTMRNEETLVESNGHLESGGVPPRPVLASFTNDGKQNEVENVLHRDGSENVLHRNGSENVLHRDGSPIEEMERTCQREFGSYCLWATEHKQEMKDALVKRLKDQLFVARAYYPSIAKLPSKENLYREMKQSIQDHEHMLSEAIVDADLPSFAVNKMVKMGETIAKAKALPVECYNVDKKLRQILDLTEDEAQFHLRQSAFLYRLAVQTTPKSLHCLSMRLTLEYFKNSSANEKDAYAEKIQDESLQHYVIFSKNVLASSVTINSTVVNSKVSESLVFHVLTDRQNYYAMKFWFSSNSYNGAVIHVLNIEDFDLKSSYKSGIHYFSTSEEFRISFPIANQSSQMRTEYTSILGHSHFLLPDFFKSLKKVILLDDDVVIQQDLSSLWNLDMGDKAVGAIQFCHVKFRELKEYLGSSGYDGDSCLWMTGLNVVNLEKWRERDITGAYMKLLQQMQVQSSSVTSWRSAALPISLLAFKDSTFPIDNSLVLSGLGKDYGISADKIGRAAVLHYNGDMKPWLELGIPQYKSYWRRFLTQGNHFMGKCNANL